MGNPTPQGKGGLRLREPPARRGVISCRFSVCYFPLPLVPSRRGRGKFTSYDSINTNLHQDISICYSSNNEIKYKVNISLKNKKRNKGQIWMDIGHITLRALPSIAYIFFIKICQNTPQLCWGVLHSHRLDLGFWNNLVKSLPTSLFRREERSFPLLRKGNEGGLDGFFKALKCDGIVKSHIPYVVHASTSSARTEYQ